jgi:hypothetical protein
MTVRNNSASYIPSNSAQFPPHTLLNRFPVSVVSPETLPENIPNLSDEDLLRLYNEFASIPAGVSPLADIFHNRAKLLKAEIEKRDQQNERAKSFAQWKAAMFPRDSRPRRPNEHSSRDLISGKARCDCVCGSRWTFALGCSDRVIQRVDALKHRQKFCSPQDNTLTKFAPAKINAALI